MVIVTIMGNDLRGVSLIPVQGWVDRECSLGAPSETPCMGAYQEIVVEWIHRIGIFAPCQLTAEENPLEGMLYSSWVRIMT